MIMAKEDKLLIPWVNAPSPKDAVLAPKEDDVLIPWVNAPANDPKPLTPTEDINKFIRDTGLLEDASKIDTTLNNVAPLPVWDTAPRPEAPEVKPQITTELPKPKIDWSINDAQSIKTTELANQETENRLKTDANTKTLANFEAALNTWNRQDIANLTKSNPDLRDTFNSMVRNQFKTNSDRNYFSKYSWFTNNQLSSAVKTWEIVVWSEQYNSLPEAQKASFQTFQAQENAVATPQDTKNQFATNNDKTISLDSILTDLKSVFSSDLRTQYEETMNSSEITQTAKDLEDKQNAINALNDNIEAIKDEVQASFPNLPWSQQAAIISDRTSKLNKDKNVLINEYNSKLGTYQTMKDQATLELDFLKYEDAQNKELYMTALWLYESRRSEMKDEEKATLLEKNKQIAADRTLANQKELATFNQKLSQENLSWGKYIDNGKWDLVYIKNWEEISVLTWLWEASWTSEDSNYTYQIKTNEDWSYTVFWLPKKDWLNIFQENFTLDWKQAVDWIKNTWTGQITSYGWEHDKFQGLDIDWNLWDPITVPLAWRIIEAQSHSAYWNTVVVKLSDWNEVRYSHLQSADVNIWDRIEKWGLVWTIWNTWNVLKLDWTRPNKAELAQGFGSHLDIVTKSPDWTVRSSRETENYLNTIWTNQWIELSWFVDTIDISTFNNSTFKPQNIKTDEQEAKYKNFLAEKNAIMWDKEADIEDVLKFSQWGKNLTVSSVESLTKFDSVVNQLSWIQEQIAKMKTWPIVWELASINPYKTDAQVLKAQLTALIPNLARWVYWEVWVLTDNDVRLYSKTIPNLTSTNDVNDAVLAMTLKVVAWGYKRQLQNLAAAWQDVSWFQWLYDNLTWQVEAIETRLWIKDVQWWAAEWTVTTPSWYTMDYSKLKANTVTNNAPYTWFWTNNNP